MKKIFGVLMIMCGLVLGVAQPVAADSYRDPICDDLDLSNADDREMYNMLGCGDTDVTLADEFANNIITVVLGLVGLVAVGVMIYGGIMYATSTGDAAKVQRAKNIIMYGLIGFGVTLLAYALVSFVMKAISSTS